MAVLCAEGCDSFAAPDVDIGYFAACCGGGGTCVPAGAVDPAFSGRLQRAECQQDLLCAPTSFALDASRIPAACRVPGDFEGRCLSNCLPEVAQQGRRLAQSACLGDERCVPCFQPLTGEDTGACRLNNDAPRDPARTFGTCCESQGRCVPQAAVELVSDPAQRERLGRDSCDATSAEFCVPNELLGERPTLKPCRGIGGAEGRCSARCLPELAARADDLQQDVCAASELCAPCFDPLTGEDTGACTLGDDRPREPAQLFGHCCGELGRCVPRALVERSLSDSRDGLLGAESCAPEDDALCVPGGWLEEPISIRACRARGDYEGRCVPGCLPSVEARAAQLDAADCGEGVRCVPCYDPLTGEPTGACGVRGDRPYAPPMPLARCCNGAGLCVPRPLLLRQASERDVARLGPEGCDDSDDALCLPAAWSSGEIALAPCRAQGDLEGRCLPSCLPEVASQAARLDRSRCAEGELCSPCYDPLNGEDTGACRLGNDEPEEPAKTFASCCGGDGRCVPRAILRRVQSEQDLARLGSSDCVQGDETLLCVPLSLAGVHYEPIECRALGGMEGRCSSGCLPEVQARAARLHRDVCGDRSLCVPCYDPISGADTQACRVSGDAPRQAPERFASCCGAGDASAGLCVPAELLTSEQRELAPANQCPNADTGCVPRALLSEPGPAPCMRSSLLGTERGICLSDCFASPLALLFASRETCKQAEICVPCSSLGPGVPGCS